MNNLSTTQRTEGGAVTQEISRAQFNMRAGALRSTAMVALVAAGALVAPSAFAQTQSANQQVAQAKTGVQQSTGEPAPIEEVVVSGTRIVRDGYSAPTPVSVITPEQLNSAATGNIADYVNQMPSFFGSTTPLGSGHGSSAANAGLNTLNLRSLGAIRTLVLLDGQRSVGSTTTGLVDINTLPQDLISRVDVVTGGASAAYGSDALAGVVNFVLDKTYTGTKIDLSGGVTTYGDDYAYRLRLTEGFAFGGGRGHVIMSGEFSNNNGIRTVPRAWNNTGAQIINNPSYTATNGLPQYSVYNHVGNYGATAGGTIDSTALAGTTFGPGGTPRAIQFGPIVSYPFEVGGDWAALQTDTVENLDPSLVSNRIFARAQYDITDNIDVFAQVSWAGARNYNVNEPDYYIGNLTIKSDNAFIPASVAARAAALHIPSFTLGTMNGDLPPWQNYGYRQTRRIVFGADGKFNTLGSDWSWNAYYQDGKTYSYFHDTGDLNVPNYMAAIDAVSDPATGRIVCRSTLASPNNGCVPFNVMGTGVNSAAAVNYVDQSGPFQKLGMEEQVFSATLSGEPFSDWAGVVSLTTGVEHRFEQVRTTSDSQSGQWFGANFVPTQGHYGVTEGFVETVVPLAKDAWFANAMDINAAVRATDYTTAGFVTTWKAGLTWDVIPGIRIRGTRSRDIRAPNLSELFQTSPGATQTDIDPIHNNNPVHNVGVTTGNLSLKPETSDGTGLGVVLQPSILNNFSLSVDYWEMDIKNAITTITPQQTINLCAEGYVQYCALITPDISKLPTTPTQISVLSEPVNLASQTASGIDFEADYHFSLDDLVSGWAGTMALHWIGTHYITNVTDNSLNPPTQIVGSSLPKWRHVITATYTSDPWTVSLTGRLTSAGVLNNNYIECQTGCPASTTNNPTISNNYQPGSFYLDTSINYNFAGPYSTDMQLYLNVQNILNKDPAIIPEGPGGGEYNVQTNTSGIYDLLGRVYRLGIRIST